MEALYAMALNRFSINLKCWVVLRILIKEVLQWEHSECAILRGGSSVVFAQYGTCEWSCVPLELLDFEGVGWWLWMLCVLLCSLAGVGVLLLGLLLRCWGLWGAQCTHDPRHQQHNHHRNSNPYNPPCLHPKQQTIKTAQLCTSMTHTRIPFT